MFGYRSNIIEDVLIPRTIFQNMLNPHYFQNCVYMHAGDELVKNTVV